MANTYRFKLTCSLRNSVLSDNVRRFTVNFDGMDVLVDAEVKSTDTEAPDSFEFDISKDPGFFLMTMINMTESIGATTILLQDIYISNNAGVDYYPLSLHRGNTNGTILCDPRDTPHQKYLKNIQPNTLFTFNIELPNDQEFNNVYDAKTVAEKIALCDKRIAENRARLATPEGASELNYDKLTKTKAMWEKFLD